MQDTKKVAGELLVELQIKLTLELSGVPKMPYL